MLYFASKFRRLPNGKQKRLESLGFAGLTAAMSVTHDMNTIAEPGVNWVVTVHHKGEHFPAIVERGAGAAVAIAKQLLNV